jgi:hypothetical protein
LIAMLIALRITTLLSGESFMLNTSGMMPPVLAKKYWKSGFLSA